MITEDYVSFEVAKLLKEKGFNNNLEKCYRSYNGKETEVFKSWYKTFDYYVSNFIQRPTIQMVMKWLRIEHNIHIEILMTNHSMSELFDIPKYYWVAVNAKTCKWITESTLYSAKQFDTNEEACEAGIKHCLENLI